jgi:hypothetical protein
MASLKRRRRAIRDEVLLDEPLDPTAQVDPRMVAPAWGWRRAGGGRASHVGQSPEYQGTTSQVCGLFPFVAGSGAPHIGVPIGRHMHWGQVVCLEPFAWLANGLVTNPGIFVLGQPGVGKALALDTPIATPTGWSTMGDLQPGDVVFDESGRPTEVVAATEVLHDRECWELELSDGSTFVADADHLWVTEQRAARATNRLRVGPFGPPPLSPAERVVVAAARERVGLPTAGPAGGGETSRPRPALWPVAAPDRPALAAHTTTVTTRTLAATLLHEGRPNHAIAVARPLQLPAVGTTVELAEGRLPAAWLRAAESQRRRLLGAILDRFGTTADGTVAIALPDRGLAGDVFELSATLALQPRMRPPADDDPAGRWLVTYPAQDGERRHVVRAEPVASRPVRCIQVAAPSGMYLAGRAMVPTHNSSIGKRLMTGMCAYGIHPMVLGDVKPDYTRLVSKLGGQVIRVGRGLDRINPLDSGPLGQAISRLEAGGHAEMGRRMVAELRGRRIALLAALCALGRGHNPVTPGEEVMLGAALDQLTATLPLGTDPTILDVLDMIREAPDELIVRAEVDSLGEFRRDSKFLRQTLRLLIDGSLRGMFDGPTSEPLDLDAPAIDIDLSAVANGGEDTAVAASMLCTWAYGFGVVDASLALSEVGLAPARNYVAYLDELWRALRGAPGLVDRVDTLTRVNRQKGMAQIMMTHSLADLDALPTEEDRAKAKGFVERCSVTILGGLPPRELDLVAEVVGELSIEERRMVSSWSTPTSWSGGEAHPGRGKYLIKAGMRAGIPVELQYVGDEADLYDTDAAAIATVRGVGELKPAVAAPAITETERLEVEIRPAAGVNVEAEEPALNLDALDAQALPRRIDPHDREVVT